MEEGTGAESLLNKIKPPRLEDAGLEDCALAPELIKEAFLKAASAVRSPVEDDSADCCVDDLWEDLSDAFVGKEEGVNAPYEGCASKKGSGLTEAPGDKVSTGDGNANSNVLSQKTHYEIIGVKEDVSQEEIRKTYRSAILNYHPDKLKMSCEASNPEPDLESKFLQVQEAWEILSNPQSRALYDIELQTMRQYDVTAEDVSIEDMSIEDDGNCFELSCHCRCGDRFSVNSSELSEIGCLVLRSGNEISLQTPESLPASIILPCGSCSLKVKLIIDANITVQTLVV